MDWQPIFNLLGAGVIAGVGWFLKGVIDENKKTAETLGECRLDVARNYVTHGDLGDIKETLRRIEDKLDNKQDK